MKVKIKDNSLQVKAALQEQALKAMEKCGLLAEGYAKDSLTNSGAVDTGALRNSISHKVTEEDEEIVAYIGTNVQYAPYIEFGTGIHYAGGRRTSWTYQDAEGNWHKTNGMRPRPYLRPAVADHAKDYKKIIETTLKGE